MKMHLISTGSVQITQNWVAGQGKGIKRLGNTLLDRRMSAWLPIYCMVIEHPDGLIVLDTGIATNANDRVWFPPTMILVQRAAKFRITRDEEIDTQMHRRGLNPADVRTVILTHLHQDHEGGLHHFANAEFIVSRAEWEAAQGMSGRMGGYLNWRWPADFSPTLIDFTDGAYANFAASQRIHDNLVLVPTPGHSAGHLSVVIEHESEPIVFAGDVSYTKMALLDGTLDGISPDVKTAQRSMQHMQTFVEAQNAIYLPSHDPESEARLKTALTECMLA